MLAVAAALLVLIVDEALVRLLLSLAGLVHLDEGDGQEQEGNGDEGGDEEELLDGRLRLGEAYLELGGRVGGERVGLGAGAARGLASGGDGLDAAEALVSGERAVRVALVAVEGLVDWRRRRHEHHDEQVEQRRRNFGLARPVGRPLVEDGEDQVAEDSLEEDDLGDELEKDLLVVFVLEVVEQRESDADSHLDDANDDGDLHLERVEKGDLIGRVVPDRVDARDVRLARHELQVVLGAAPVRRAEEGHREGEALIVHEADKGAEEAVEQQDVAAAIDHLYHVAQLRLAPLLLLGDEVVAEERKEDAVSEVAEHDAEEVREHDAAEGARVGLAIARRAVGVHERLEAGGERGDGNVGRRREASRDLVDERRVAALGALALGERRGELGEGVDRHPTLDRGDVGALNVVVGHIKRVEDHLLAQHDVVPLVELGAHLRQHAEDLVLLNLERELSLFKLRLSLLELGGVLCRSLREGVEVGAEVGGDLLDLVGRALGDEEDHEKGLVEVLCVPLAQGLNVKQRLVDRRAEEDGVAARRAPDDALERVDRLVLHDTGNELHRRGV
mmetsp:Transcript_41757/g.91698  ORF Transcript_41757/g.91698 Transcript_41757/m.91698 type:complete len:561 (+) Transcript_41757:813-2495(+)